jgi:hypothetical protein
LKRHLIESRKILIAVVVSAGGCTSPSPAIFADDRPATATASPIDQAHESTDSTPAAASPPARGERAKSTDPKLLALRDELFYTSQKEALAKREHFKPLCDADGFPVVGNVYRKDEGYQASAFCRDLNHPPDRS